MNNGNTECVHNSVSKRKCEILKHRYCENNLKCSWFALAEDWEKRAEKETKSKK